MKLCHLLNKMVWNRPARAMAMAFQSAHKASLGLITLVEQTPLFTTWAKKDSQWLLSIPVRALCGIWMQTHDCCKPNGGIRYKNTNLGVDSADILPAETNIEPQTGSTKSCLEFSRSQDSGSGRWLDPLRSHIVFPVVNLCGKPLQADALASRSWPTHSASFCC